MNSENKLPQIPWEEDNTGGKEPVWRYSGNPIIGRDGNKISNSVFNSAVVRFEDGFAGVFRCDSRSISMDIGREKMSLSSLKAQMKRYLRENIDMTLEFVL